MDLARDHVRLDPMSKLEALDLLKTTFADDWEDDQTDDAQTHLEELSCIPLAIVHAACGTKVTPRILFECFANIRIVSN